MFSVAHSQVCGEAFDSKITANLSVNMPVHDLEDCFKSVTSMLHKMIVC